MTATGQKKLSEETHKEQKPMAKVSKRVTKERVRKICDILNETYTTEYKCYLNHENAWQLLIATMLSAQCTDARVNIVTEKLFKKYTSLEAFARADIRELIPQDFIRIKRKTSLEPRARSLSGTEGKCRRALRS